MGDWQKLHKDSGPGLSPIDNAGCKMVPSAHPFLPPLPFRPDLPPLAVT